MLSNHALSFAPVPDRRLAGVLATVLLHAALILGWQLARTLPPAQLDGKEAAIQWIDLPPPRPRTAAPPVKPEILPEPPRPAIERAERPAPARPGVAGEPLRPALAAPAAAVPSAPSTPAEEGAAAPASAPAAPNAKAILENALRSAGSIDSTLRKSGRPLIITPPDSPAIRMRQGMEQARALAPPRLWEAPKVEELVNNTGDGARRTRVITGNGTYCVTERSPVTNVEMIEMHGKIRLTNCPTPEEPPKQQVWRTARD